MQATVAGLRTGTAARLLGVSEQTIRTLVRRRKLQATVTPLGLLIDEQSAHDLAAQREAAARARQA